MNDESDFDHLVLVLLNANSENELIRKDSENKIRQMMQNPPQFLLLLSNIILTPNVQLPVIQISLILVSQMLQTCSSDQNQNNLANNQILCNSLKTMIITSLNHENIVIKNLAAKLYALLFQILKEYWTDGLDLILTNIDDLPNGAISSLKIFYEILERKDYLLFTNPQYRFKFIQLFQCCVKFIGVDQSNDQITVGTDIRLLSSQCVIKCFQKIPSYIINSDFFNFIIKSLRYSFPIADNNLFQYLFQIMKCMITEGYDIIKNCLSDIFDYSLNCFSCLQSPFYIETLFYFWGEIAHFEYKKKDPYQEITAKSAESILKMADKVFKNVNLPEILDFNSPTYSLVLTTQATITNFYKCAPIEVSKIILSNFQSIVENGASPFSGLCFISSISIKTNTFPFSKQFLIFIDSLWNFLLSFENQANLTPEQAKNESFISIRITALTVIKKLIKTFYLYEDITKLADIFTLIKKDQLRQKDEHPAILLCYARIIGSICDEKTETFIPKQILYVDDNYQVLSQYLWSLYDLNYNHCIYPILLEETADNMNLLISKALKSDKNVFDFLTSFFTYSEEKLSKSKSLFESEEIRYVIQKTLCSFIGNLGMIMATNNDVCKRSFESLMTLIQNPNKLIYEDALKSIASFIPNVHQMIDQGTLMFLVDNVAKSLKTCSFQIIISASVLLQQMLESVPNRIFDAVPDLFHLLSQILRDHPEFRESHYYILKTLSTLFTKIDPQYTIVLRDEYLSLIECVESVINILDLNSQYDIDYANIFYEFLCGCYLSYVNAFIQKPTEGSPREMFAQEKKNLEHLRIFASYINRIDNSDKTEELLHAYLNLVQAITIKCSKANDMLLNKIVIRKPIDAAEERFHFIGDLDSYKFVKKLKKQMKSIM
ncbi:hypothetical protein M9Y10_001093 [Tritrichomonas musculus]|uniref:Exportin-1 C-terminal domain-containing protein n=1 Tax=Tritrichomonas musculus TaxID=1915356 RepID=A0ABR2L608_9EUKA